MTKYKCDDCIYYNEVCTHDDNKRILIHRKVEKITYKTNDKKVKCNNYVQSQS